MIQLEQNDLVFAKVKPDAKIPTKKEENAGRDVYACFEQDYMVIPAHTTVLIPTGIASAMTPKYEIRLRDRGSNGSKGIHVNAGTIDSGYRGEWFVAWCNTNDKAVLLSKLTKEQLIEKYTEIENGNKGYLKLPIDTNKKYGFNNSFFCSMAEDLNVIIYPYEKGIAQAEVCEVPVMNEFEISYEELMEIPSERKDGALGSSGK